MNKNGCRRTIHNSLFMEKNTNGQTSLRSQAHVCGPGCTHRCIGLVIDYGKFLFEKS
jgi:hypothetical protein